jgi:hypothetical protein
VQDLSAVLEERRQRLGNAQQQVKDESDQLKKAEVELKYAERLVYDLKANIQAQYGTTTRCAAASGCSYVSVSCNVSFNALSSEYEQRLMTPSVLLTSGRG